MGSGTAPRELVHATDTAKRKRRRKGRKEGIKKEIKKEGRKEGKKERRKEGNEIPGLKTSTCCGLGLSALGRIKGKTYLEVCMFGQSFV